MKRWSISLAAVGALATLGLGVGGGRTAIGHGSGVLENRAGVRAAFTLKVAALYAPDGDEELEGHFAFGQRDPKAGTAVEVTMKLPRGSETLPAEFVVDREAAYLSAAAVLTRSTRGSKERVEGVLTLLVTDRGERNGRRASKDRVWLQFEPAGEGLAFDYRGEVARGSLRLWQRHLTQR